jgi:four helix bundle protein
MIRQLVRTFPPEEKYSLCAQLSRSARSITANLAEGYGRYSFQENIQFCRQARGSLLESLEHLIAAQDEDYISLETLQNCRNQYKTVLRLLNGYIAYLRKRKGE